MQGKKTDSNEWKSNLNQRARIGSNCGGTFLTCRRPGHVFNVPATRARWKRAPTIALLQNHARLFSCVAMAV